MKHGTVIRAFLFLAVLPSLVASPVSAAWSSWHFGGAFNVGGVHFRVGFSEGGRYGSSYYFEAAKPFAYRGYGCSDRCYRRGGNYYHHPSCRAVNHHFSRHGYAPNYLIAYYGPRQLYRDSRYYGPSRYYSYHRQPAWDNHHRQRHHKKHYQGNYRYQTPPGHHGGLRGYHGDDDSDSH
jgi:hypothetical protein